MAITTYPLNGIQYSAEDAELYNCTRNSGVYSGGEFDFAVSGTNNNIVIGEGVGWIRNGRFSGKVFANRDAETIALDVADAVYPRIDVIGVRYETATNRTDIFVKKGVASANPVIPDIVQTETVYELYFYSIYRETAATAITADNVTDLRLDANYCGLMGDAITSIDTSAINAQFQAFLAKIKKELADLKVGKIDAYSREESLSSTTKAALGLSEDAVPDDAFADLAAKIAGGAKIVTGSYVGTGTYGEKNPCSLTFDFAPQMIMLIGHKVGNSIAQLFGAQNYNNSNNRLVVFAKLLRKTGYIQDGFTNGSSTSGYAKISDDEKTIYWYHTSASYQANSNDYTYYYLAIG